MTRPAVVVEVAATASDLNGIGLIDPSYTSDRIYRLRRTELGFWFEEEPIEPPIAKKYPRPSPQLSDRLMVARVGTEIVGSGELRFDSWSKRAEIEYLIVSGSFRSQGVGRSLIDALHERARQEPSIRCLWLETQNYNYPAIQFYQRMGFRLCGLDETLYRPGLPGLLPGEVALYFSRNLI